MNPPIIDCHVHLIGNGLHGSGCYLSLHGTARVFASYMCSNFGLPTSVLRADLENEYQNKLAQYVRESSLDKVMALASDHVRDENGNILAKFDRLVVPNDFVLRASLEHPEFIPAVSIHPARPDAIEELDRCHAEGAKMMKCLPNYHNINCNDARYSKFWKRMADLQMILLAHTGGELSLPNVGPEYRNPETLRLPLESGVTVIGAHCGTRALPTEKDYRKEFLAMLDQYPNFYGDNSALTAPNRARAAYDLAKGPFAYRILHGSDIPIPVSATWLGLFGKLPWAVTREINKTRNPLERDYLIKRALGFPEASFRKLGELLGL